MSIIPCCTSAVNFVFWLALPALGRNQYHTISRSSTHKWPWLKHLSAHPSTFNIIGVDEGQGIV